MIHAIENILFQLANWLHLPIFLGLFFMVIWLIWSLGVFVREWVELNQQKRVKHFFDSNKEVIDSYLTENTYADIKLTELVQRWEKKENVKLDRVRALVKIAPSLGLVGTLIPMGQALSTLSSGDMTAMADHMVVAFTATIIGLVCGIVAYFISMKREQWLSADFLTCEVKLERKLRANATNVIPAIEKELELT